MRPARKAPQRIAAFAVATVMALSVLPLAAAASVGPACTPFVGSVPSFEAAPLSGGAQLTWNAAGGLVRIIRQANDFYRDATVTVSAGALGVQCWSAEATVVYEGTGSSFTDSGIENGYTYCYTAFLTDGAGGWLAPSGVAVVPQVLAPMSKPAVSTYVIQNHRFTVSGTVGERSAMRSTVRLVYYRKSGTSWVYWKSAGYAVGEKARTFRVSSYVPDDGSVKLIAKHYDSTGLLSTSPARYFYSHRR